MFKDDVLRYFKKKRLVAEALGISHVAVCAVESSYSQTSRNGTG
ncbi:putative antirepressor protein [Escherichia coli]|uniref:Putative antirepressor protein n=1 Tax=Escherichia coli TaxID=562 RepID=A0A377HFU8_ECOLX|nr:putative antirepressor protein [Escherichia coli]